jgi:hypothetical protein
MAEEEGSGNFEDNFVDSVSPVYPEDFFVPLIKNLGVSNFQTSFISLNRELPYPLNAKIIFRNEEEIGVDGLAMRFVKIYRRIEQKDFGSKNGFIFSAFDKSGKTTQTLEDI